MSKQVHSTSISSSWGNEGVSVFFPLSADPAIVLTGGCFERTYARQLHIVLFDTDNSYRVDHIQIGKLFQLIFS